MTRIEPGPVGSGEVDEFPLVTESLVQRFDSYTALDNVSLKIGQERVALVGVNGAGKSTLLTSLAGAQRPQSGLVSIQSMNPYGRRRRLALRQVALMPQSVSFPRNMTSFEIVSYLTWMRGASARVARTKARDALAAVGLQKRESSKIGELSGGMLRRVALAQVIASDAQVLLLDEPSTGLDPEQRRIMVELIGQLGRTTVMSSHVMEDVVEVADRVLILDQGRIVFDGTVSDLKGAAPAGTLDARAAEAGFLAMVTSRRGVSE